MREKTLPSLLVVTWPMVARLAGATGSTRLATSGGLLTVMLHLDSQQHAEIQEVRADALAIGREISANTALLQQLLETQP